MVGDVVKGMNDWFEDMNSFHPPLLFLHHQGLPTKPRSPLSLQASQTSLGTNSPSRYLLFSSCRIKKLFLTVYFSLYREVVIPGVAIIDLGKMERAPTFGMVTAVIINAMHYGGRGIAMIIERDRLGRMLGR